MCVRERHFINIKLPLDNNVREFILFSPFLLFALLGKGVRVCLFHSMKSCGCDPK